MTHSVYITRTAVVTPLGEGSDALFTGLMEKRSGIGVISRFDTGKTASSFAGTIPLLDTVHGSPRILDGSPRILDGSPRILDGSPRILGLTDILLDQLGKVDQDTRLIVASTKAGIENVERGENQDALSKGIFMSGLTDYISRKLKLNNAGININAACASSTIAIAKGAALIRAGAADAVLVCCMDVVSRFVFTGFSALGAMSREPARPFDRHRNGLTLGEGAAAVLLMNSARTKESAIELPVKISGWGIAGDAVHLTAPARNGMGLKRAVGAACRMAGMDPVDIFAVNTHGTGTIYNDAMELEVLKSIFDPDRVVANSIKGAIGHTLGAAGGIEVVLCKKMIEKGIMVPTKGLETPEKSAGKMILMEPAILTQNRILTINSGFGGINAALLIEGISWNEI
ncbi:MAG: beta-ketoacyl-[acyl-carrier-protein] synthase family protein [Desulfamplus sp.]|nr:beta-ketoacyl-[acyl-carrier-protein] synthase family protein [Desulfamplus sp.]